MPAWKQSEVSLGNGTQKKKENNYSVGFRKLTMFSIKLGIQKYVKGVAYIVVLKK